MGQDVTKTRLSTILKRDNNHTGAVSNPYKDVNLQYGLGYVCATIGTARYTIRNSLNILQDGSLLNMILDEYVDTKVLWYHAKVEEYKTRLTLSQLFFNSISLLNFPRLVSTCSTSILLLIFLVIFHPSIPPIRMPRSSLHSTQSILTGQHSRPRRQHFPYSVR